MGFVSVPLNVRAGVAQLLYMMEHCEAKVLFVGDEYEVVGYRGDGAGTPTGASGSV